MEIKYNEVNLKAEFLKMYIEKASYNELKEINDLLEKKDYLSINLKIEEFIKKMTKIKNIKNDDDESNPNIITFPVNKKETNEEMDEQTFELYCILKLIDEYLNEKDEEKKNNLKLQIEKALEYYRNYEPEKTRSL